MFSRAAKPSEQDQAVLDYRASRLRTGRPASTQIFDWTGFSILSFLAAASNVQSSLQGFKATSLTGQVVTEERLIGQPTVLIVTPSRSAAGETRQWAQALRENAVPLQEPLTPLLLARFHFQETPCLPW